MPTVAELDARLASVNAAITAIEGGAQSYSIGGRTLARGNLATLYAERKSLETQRDRISGDVPLLSRGRVSGLGGGR